MQRTARPVVVAATLATLLLGAGCGSAATPAGGGSGGSAPAATTDPVAWTNDLCGALVPFVQSASTPPDIDKSDPASILKGLGSFIDKALGGLDAGLKVLDGIGPSPVAGGDDAAKTMTSSLTTMQSVLKDAKATIEAADPKDPASVKKAQGSMDKISEIPDPIKTIKANPELAKAYPQAENCKSLPDN